MNKHKIFKPHTMAYLTTLAFFLPSVAMANSAANTCQIQVNLVPKLALYGISLLVTAGVGFFFSKMWGENAVKEQRKPNGELLAGWSFGLFIGAVSFAGLLYAVSEQFNEDGEPVATGSCYPDGWDLIAGVLVLVTLVIFVFTKVNAKR